MMKNFLIATLTSVALLMTSCSTVEKAREDLRTMPEQDFIELKADVQEAGIKAGQKIRELTKDVQTIEDVKTVTRQLSIIVGSGEIKVDDVILGLVDRFEDKLDPRYVDYIRDATKIIDASVGQIRLGIDGKLSDRETDLIQAFLSGVIIGVDVSSPV